MKKIILKLLVPALMAMLMVIVIGSFGIDTMAAPKKAPAPKKKVMTSAQALSIAKKNINQADPQGIVTSPAKFSKDLTIKGVKYYSINYHCIFGQEGDFVLFVDSITGEMYGWDYNKPNQLGSKLDLNKDAFKKYIDSLIASIG